MRALESKNKRIRPLEWSKAKY